MDLSAAAAHASFVALIGDTGTPLEYLDVIVVGRADRAMAAVEDLLERAVALLPLEPDGEVERLDEVGLAARWQHFRYPADCWAAAEGGFAELLLWPDDRWIARPRHQPALSAGFTFVVVEDPPLLRPSRASWRAALARRGIQIGTEDGALRCSRVLYLDEVVTRFRDAEAQAAAVAGWAAAAIDEIAGLEPPAGA